MVLIVFIIAWLISPIVLLILYCIERSVNKKLKSENERLSMLLLNKDKTPGQEASVHQAPPPAAPVRNTAAEYGYMQQPVPAPPVYTEADRPAESQPQSVREPASVPDPLSVSPQKKQGASAINTILVLGTLFVSLAGFVFAAAAWGVLNTFFKSVMLLSFSALFFGIHIAADKKLKLERTGRVFFVLGSIFLPAAAFAAGMLQVFGKYFSFSGDGKNFVVALIAVLAAVPFFIGAKKYNSAAYARTAFCAVSAAAAALLWSSPTLFPLTAALFSAFVMFLLPLLTGKRDGVILSRIGWFAAANTAVLGCVSIFTAESGYISLAALVIFGVCFMSKSFANRSGAASAVFFTVFATAGAVRGFAPDGLGDVFVIGAAVSLINAVLSAAGIFSDKQRKALKVISGIASVLGIAVGIIFSGISLVHPENMESTELLYISIASLIFFTELLFLAFREDSPVFRGLTVGGFIWAASQWMMYFGMTEHCLSLACFAGMVYMLILSLASLKCERIKRLYGVECGAVYSVITFITVAAESAWQVGFLSDCCIILAAAVCGIIVSFITAVSDGGRLAVFGKIMAPVMTASCVFPLLAWADISDMEYDSSLMRVFLIASAVSSVFASCTILIKKFAPLENAYKVLQGAALSAAAIVSLIYENSLTSAFAIIFVYTLIWLFRDVISGRKYRGAAYSAMTMLLVTIMGIGTEITDTAYIYTFPVWGIAAIFAAWLFASASNEEAAGITGRFLTVSAPLWAAVQFIACDSLYDEPMSMQYIILASAFVTAAMGAYVCEVRGTNLHMFFVMCLAFGSMREICGEAMEETIPTLILAAVLAVFGRFTHRDHILGGNGRKIRSSDIWSLSAFIAPFCMLSDRFRWYEDSGWNRCVISWLCYPVFALLVLNLIRRESSRVTVKGCQTAAAAFIMPFWWGIPYSAGIKRVPEFMELEFNMIPVLIFLVLLRIIHRDNHKITDIISFAVSGLCTLTLLFSAMSGDYVFDAVFLGLVFAVMLAVSFFIRRRRWFTLGAGGLAAEGILLTIAYSESTVWWIYLLAMGVVLIAAGIRNEIRKQQNEEKGTKRSSFLSEWEW
ncbi:MAG: hypothetical protein ACI4KF_12855 [Huintestinicola sp.]